MIVPVGVRFGAAAVVPPPKENAVFARGGGRTDHHGDGPATLWTVTVINIHAISRSNNYNAPHRGRRHCAYACDLYNLRAGAMADARPADPDGSASLQDGGRSKPHRCTGHPTTAARQLRIGRVGVLLKSKFRSPLWLNKQLQIWIWPCHVTCDVV